MTKKALKIGTNSFYKNDYPVNGEIVEIDDQECYKISNYYNIQPFFMNIVSNTDLWMFISSKGALTAGRKNSDYSLFPYYTEDRIHHSGDITGPKTLIHVNKDSSSFLWEPFNENFDGIYNVERNLYKSILGNFILFEEVNHDLKLCFRYSWSNSDKYGFVRKSQLINNDNKSIKVNLVDGVQNLLPAELNRRLQLEYSNLVDAYKKCELLTDGRLAAFTLSSVLTDRAEPNESLRANTAWFMGLDAFKVLLSNSQLKAFRYGNEIIAEDVVRGKRSAFLINSELEIQANNYKDWMIVLDVNKDQSEFISLSNELKNNKDIINSVLSEISNDSEHLTDKIAKNDGISLVNDKLNKFRHTSNVLFNIMRGGVFVDNYKINKKDFLDYLSKANFSVFNEYEDKLNALSDNISFDELSATTANSNQDLERLAIEYLPLTFSRRHGDPSRPWNHFSIDVKDQDGNDRLDYQGNWRDIFQNWEALAISYPEYIERMIAKFVNASTADGYNPYRVTRDGFDWEVIEPDDEWSYIGYWGDHQIIYLLKLLELSKKYNPEKLSSLLSKEIFTYAKVPYRIRKYQELLADPQETIDFDHDLDRSIMDRVESMGFDGKYEHYKNNEIVYTGLAEKLLTPMLVKLTNFVPGAGIWMNTQRPEWNDANNALVGYGVSMVTVYYLRRYVVFLKDFLKSLSNETFDIHDEVIDLYDAISNYLNKTSDLLNKSFTDSQRKDFLDNVGEAGSKHRIKIYKNGFSGNKNKLNRIALIDFLRKLEIILNETIKSNVREDDLYHAYNLLTFKENEIGIRRLYEMLEGQVSALSSGLLNADESIKLLRALKASKLYREDQMSYMLYPNRKLKGFLEKNTISNDYIKNDDVLYSFTQKQSKSILIKDELGNWHFNSKYKNARILEEDLEKLLDGSHLTKIEKDKLLECYEYVFDHQSFTGRSGTFFKYEGLGSIYWHMVSKLLLALQETYLRLKSENESESKLSELKSIYYDIKNGLGVHKNPSLYGSFPTDAYSHTPESEGVQQPGMTGQVKEDILSRFGELGVSVNNGKISFNTYLLNGDEYLTNQENFEYFNVENNKKKILIEKDALGFTICQVPVILKKSNQNMIRVFKGESFEELFGNELSKEISKSIFQRNNMITKIEVEITTS